MITWSLGVGLGECLQFHQLALAAEEAGREGRYQVVIQCAGSLGQYEL